jgi:DNA-directed RNA polymerase subunit RPC12/RpoP
MSLDVKCPECGSELEVPPSAAGKKVKCPDCGTRISVPDAEEAIQPKKERPQPSREEDEEDRPRRRRREEEEDEDDRPRRQRREEEDEDEEDDRPRRRRRRSDDYDEGLGTLIPYKNGKALAAYYLGVFSFIPCAGNILGPLAIIFGVLGLRYVKERPRARGTGHAWAGIIMGTLTTLAYWVGPLILIAIGAFSSH